ncbi:hypothetical protein QUF56_09405 [Ureibacillus composti]|nr:hypothetical protein [Ureibacillus composti]
MSLAYNFILNMWVMKRVDQTFVQAQVTHGRLTKEEADMILATPQTM